MSDKIILVGGSKDGVETDGAAGLNSVQNIVLNEDFTGPEYVDRYVATGVQDREGRDVFAHVGRYTAEESQSYWESLDKDQVAAFVEAEKAERAEAEAKAKEEEEAKAAEEAEAAKAAEEAVANETVGEVKPEGEAAEEEPGAEVESAEEEKTDDKED